MFFKKMLLFIKQNLSLRSSIMDFSNFFLKSILSIKKWIPDSELIGFRIPNQIWILNSIIVDSGFQQPYFARFRILLHGSIWWFFSIASVTIVQVAVVHDLNRASNFKHDCVH